MLQKVTEGVYVHQSELLQNNSVVIQGTDGVLVVDAGITGSEMACLAKDVQGLGQSVVAGFSTHPDWDHVLWHQDLGTAPRYGTERCAAFMKTFRAKKDWETEAKQGLPEEIADEIPLELFGLITGLPAGTTQLPWNGPATQVLEHTAHAQGHAALFIEEHGVLVAGDMLSDIFVPMLDTEAPDPTGEYLAALDLFANLADKIRFVIPGHGSVAEGDQVRARIELDRAYVMALRDGTATDDPRVVSPKEGWEWVSSIHEGQVQQLAKKK